jgi:hypothetical protein
LFQGRQGVAHLGEQGRVRLWRSVLPAATLRYAMAEPRSQGFLSDWVVAWRCYVLFGRRRWMAWFGIIGFIATTGKLPHFSSPINCNTDRAAAIATYVASIHGVNFVWAPIYLANNTLMSAMIVSKIMCVVCPASAALVRDSWPQ